MKCVPAIPKQKKTQIHLLMVKIWVKFHTSLTGLRVSQLHRQTTLDYEILFKGQTSWMDESSQDEHCDT